MKKKASKKTAEPKFAYVEDGMLIGPFTRNQLEKELLDEYMEDEEVLVYEVIPRYKWSVVSVASLKPIGRK